MKLLKCKSSINKLMVVLEFFSNIAYNVFIVKERNQNLKIKINTRFVRTHCSQISENQHCENWFNFF
jgi:hypothetical protein